MKEKKKKSHKYDIMQTASGASVTEKPHFTVQAASPKEMFICLPNIHLHININAHHVIMLDL